MPCAAATALPSSTSRETSRRSVGPLADAAVREPGERAERVRRRVEDHLAPLRAARVGDRVRRHAAARAGVGEPLDLLERRRRSLERAERRVALHVPLHDAGRDDLPGRERRAADHALDVRGEHLLVADPVLHGRDAAVGERVRGRGDRRRRCASPSSRRCRSRTAAARLRRSSRAAGRRTSPAPVSRSPSRLIASTCSLRQVVGPDLDVVERREVRREQRADRAAADDADLHCHDASFALISRSIAACSGTGHAEAVAPRARASR